MSLAPGSRLGPYEVVALLGAGGMGAVYRVRDARLQRDVALKILNEEVAGNPERRARFEREARAAAALSHPNIIAVYDIGEDSEHLYLVTELLAGETLRVRLRSGPLAVPDALDIAMQIASGMAAAHRAGITHRDLKPENVMIGAGKTVKILDFGLARLDTERAIGAEDATVTVQQTPAGMVVGTPQYMSPEQTRGAAVDYRSDQFALGLIVHEMLTGTPAFRRASMPESMIAVLKEEAPPLPETVPAPLRWLVERALSKDPSDRYTSTDDLYRDLRAIREHLSEVRSSGALPALPAGRRTRRSWGLLMGAACAAAAFLAGMWWSAPGATETQSRLVRLTREAGMSRSPALSPDGKLVAYSSDSAGEGHFDLYVRQIAGGQPIRLTTDGAGNTSPDFSPDGSRIVFRSNRDRGGIYEVPAFGGQVRLIAREGRNPKYSPDALQVAYWTGDPNVNAAVPGSGTVWVIPAAGGEPRKLAGFTASRYPIWAPDGRRLLVAGYTSVKAYEDSAIDWWIADANGGTAARTGMHDAMARANMTRGAASNPGPVVAFDVPVPGCWPKDGRTLIFSSGAGDSINLWQVGISARTGKVDGVFRRLTTAAELEQEPSCSSSGAVAFTKFESRQNVWSQRLDPIRGIPVGALDQITDDLAKHEYPSLSANGRYMVFDSDQSGRLNIRRREVPARSEVAIAESAFVQRFPVSNGDGSRVAYSVYENGKRVVYGATVGETPEKLCEGCLRATDWSADEKGLVVFGGNPYQVSVLDLASHGQRLLLSRPGQHVLYGRLSPDNRWISFTVRTERNRGRIAIAPVDGATPVPENAWIPIAEEGEQDWANWSAGGTTLYFTSKRDGHACLWGQRLATDSHRPAGDPFPVLHLHGRLTYVDGGWSAAGDRIVMALEQLAGNVWVMSRTTAQR